MFALENFIFYVRYCFGNIVLFAGMVMRFVVMGYY